MNTMIISAFPGCGKTYTVTIVSTPVEITNNSSIYGQITAETYNRKFTIQVEKDGVVGNVDIPKPAFATFEGWFTDESYTYQWNTATDPVKGNMTLYAKWSRN